MEIWRLKIVRKIWCIRFRIYRSQTTAWEVQFMYKNSAEWHTWRSSSMTSSFIFSYSPSTWRETVRAHGSMSSTCTLLPYLAPMSSSSCATLVKPFPSTTAKGLRSWLHMRANLSVRRDLTPDGNFRLMNEAMLGWFFPEFALQMCLLQTLYF